MEGLENAKFFNQLTYKIFLEAFAKSCSTYLKGNLIDIGCGTKPYRNICKPFVKEHIGVDHEATFHDKSKIDLFGTAYDIPTEAGRFDSAICTAVLEHLEEPEMAIRECYRVLKPGGFAIYSVPFIWHLHESPRDFFRYSSYGLNYLFTKTGFKVIELIPLAGFLVTFFQLHLYFLKRFDRGIIKHLRIFRAYAWAIQKLGFFVHRHDHSYEWTWMYITIVQK